MQPASGNATPDPSALGAYLRPFAATNNLSGTVFVERAGRVLFAKSYGLADRTKKIPNRLDTRYHIASISILFTSTAVLRLIDQGKLSFDTRVSEIVAGVPNGEKITVRELLEQTSGLPDSHDLPNYDSLLTRHQTPKSLVDFIRNARPYAAPGTPNNGDREEHSGQNVLALIIERRTGLKFKQAMQKEVFDPLGMRDSGIDDDTPISATLALGNQGSGPFGLKAAPTIHWSALPGNGSAYTTVGDEWKWLHSLVHGTFLSAASRKAMLGTSEGYGWERYTSKRVNETVYTAGGRAPGFSCFFEYLPSDDTLILALTNLENAANPIIIANAAALLRGKPYQGFHYTYVAPAVAGFPHGNFTFGKDFYRPSATLRLVSNASGVTLNWPGGPMSALLPLSKDHFWDRYYWSPVAVIRDSGGKLAALQYDKFKGTIASAPLR